MNKHTQMLHKILYNNEALASLGIEGKIWGALEVPWWRNGQLYCETDIIIYTGDIYERPFHCIEYKASRKHRANAMKQIRKSEEFISFMFSSQCYKYLVTGRKLDYEIIGIHLKKR